MMEELKIHKSTEMELDNFLKLPRKAQLIFFEDFCFDFLDAREDILVHYYANGFNTDCCKSPIEQIFMFAFNREIFRRRSFLVNILDLVPQYEINTKGYKYFADFYVEFCDEEFYEELGENVKIIIECDGHDYHQKTKAQVKRDNERDYDLKMNGYDVLHFSGSQIYNSPIKCADEAIDYIEMKVAGVKKLSVGCEMDKDSG